MDQDKSKEVEVNFHIYRLLSKGKTKNSYYFGESFSLCLARVDSIKHGSSET